MMWLILASSLATGKAMASSIIPISGKTGTAETYATDGSGNSVTTVNLNAVAYATAKDGTKLAVGIMYPHALDSKSKAQQKLQSKLSWNFIKILTKYENLSCLARGIFL